MTKRLRPLAVSLLLLGALAAHQAGSKTSSPGRETNPKGSCAVCGMYVANFPNWAASVTFRDGSQAWFDGPKDLFTFLLDLRRFAPKRAGSDIIDIRVKDYYTLKPIDGRRALFVLGSDVMGPMGKELVPFGQDAAARDFLKDHRGTRVLTFPEISAAVLKGLE
jgi:copper chaperone NosL